MTDTLPLVERLRAVEPGTPLPWSIDDDYQAELHGADDTLIALLLGSEQSFQTWEIDPGKARLGHFPERAANAAYIVHAANTLPQALALIEQLVSALEPFAREAAERSDTAGDSVVPTIESAEDGTRATALFTIGDLRHARATLSQARGEQP